MIQYQILQTYIIRMVWQTVRRITEEILGVKGSREWECLPKNKIIHVPIYVLNAFVAFSNKQVMVKKNSGLTGWKKEATIWNCGSLICSTLSQCKKESLLILKDLNNLQISVLKNVEKKTFHLKNVTFHLLIKTITKFVNMIGYHQPNLSTYSTVYAPCL